MSENVSDAQAAEARKEPAVAKFRGHEFTIPREYSEWPLELAEALEDGSEIGILRGALGPVQWRLVRAMHLKVSDLNELTESITSALGFGSVGESSPSSD